MKKKAAEIAATFEKQGMSAEKAMKKAWQQITNDAFSGASKTKSAVVGMNSAFTSLGKSVHRLGGILTSVLGPIAFIGLAKECIELGSSVNEVQNVVDTAFGSMAYKMEQFADTAITSFGMSELAAKKTGSTYMAMAKGIGIADEKASNMAITLTGLTGDVASFFNSSQDEAATKLKSVFTGETESLKELGVVMTQTNLEQFAMSKGITKSISAMTQAELATLRYNFVLDSLNLASGDFVKTQDSWANQTRILSENMKALGANVGNILTTVLLPSVKSLNEIVSNLVEATNIISAAVSSIFGVQISQNTAIANSAEKAAEAENALADGINSAAQAAKKATAGFDELNVLQSNTGSSIDFGGTDISYTNQTTITNSEAMDPAKVARVAEIIKEIASYIPVIAGGLAGLRLGKFLTDLATAHIEAKSLKDTLNLLGKKAAITVGITLAITGIVMEGTGIFDTIQNGLDGSNLLKILLGGSSISIGLSMALSKITPAIKLFGKQIGSKVLGSASGAIIAGLPAFFAGIYDAAKNGLDLLNASLIAVSATAAGAGIGALVGTIAGPMGTAIGALIGLATGLITDGILAIFTDHAAPAVDVLTESEKKLVEQAEASAKALRDQRAATQETIAGINSQYEYVDRLADELFTLADASGKVEEKDRSRAEFILGRLNEALGTEYKVVGNTIQQYDKLKSSIDELVQSKLANALLDASEGDYVAAIEAKSDLLKAATLKQKEYNAQLEKTNQAEKDYLAKQDLLNKAMLDGDIYKQEYLNFDVADAQTNWEREKRILADKETAYKNAKLAVKENYEEIADYEAAQTAALSGNYVAAKEILTQKSIAFGEYSESVDAETAKVLDSLYEEAVEMGYAAQNMRANFESGIGGYTEDMVAEAENGYRDAMNAFANAYADAESIGDKISGGLKKGLLKNKEDLVETAKGMIEGIVGEWAVSIEPTQQTIPATWNDPHKLMLWNIPYLAQGAVIPPNHEFMAVLGDQKHGTNIEAPLETIKQALAEVLALQENSFESVTNVNFTGDLAQLARILKPEIDVENRRVGGSLAKGATY